MVLHQILKKAKQKFPSSFDIKHRNLALLELVQIIKSHLISFDITIKKLVDPKNKIRKLTCAYCNIYLTLWMI
jgi:hypothetical protein